MLAVDGEAGAVVVPGEVEKPIAAGLLVTDGKLGGCGVGAADTAGTVAA